MTSKDTNSADGIKASNNPDITVEQTTKLEAFLNFFTSNKGFILLSAVGLFIVSQVFDIPLPEIEFWHIYVAVISGMGYIGGRLIWSQIRSYIGEERVIVDIIPFQTEVSERIYVPRDQWMDMDVIGDKLPSRTTLTGERVYGVRAIDFDQAEIFPADDFPNEEAVPSYWDIIARGTEKDDKRYRDYLLDKAKKYSQMVVDDEVIREDARGDAVMMYAKGLQDGRNGEIDVERKPDEETILEAEQVIKQMSESNNGGEGQ